MTGQKRERCKDCPEHSGVVAKLDAGDTVMTEIKDSMAEMREEFKEQVKLLKKEFTDQVSTIRDEFQTHIKTQTARTITLLILVISTLLTGLVSIYVNSIKNTHYQQIADQATIADSLKVIIEIMKDDRDKK